MSLVVSQSCTDSGVRPESGPSAAAGTAHDTSVPASSTARLGLGAAPAGTTAVIDNPAMTSDALVKPASTLLVRIQTPPLPLSTTPTLASPEWFPIKTKGPKSFTRDRDGRVVRRGRIWGVMAKNSAAWPVSTRMVLVKAGAIRT
jgi:hypothetical protein